MNQPNNGRSAERLSPSVAARALSREQLAQLGMQQVAYVKPVTLHGEAAFSIHAADGTPMGVAAERDLAFAAISQHEMQPLSVH